MFKLACSSISIIRAASYKESVVAIKILYIIYIKNSFTNNAKFHINS
jgi:hypothetical protein